MTLRRLAAAAALLSLIPACSGDPAKLQGERWVLDPASIARLGVEVPAGTIVDLTFGEDGSLGGTSGCNTYHATYQAGNGSLDLGDIAVTEMACEDPAVMELESAYLDAFSQVTGWKVQPGFEQRPALTLTDGDRVELRYTALA